MGTLPETLFNVAGPVTGALLRNRFQLEFHREKRVLEVYELVVSSNGIKFRASAPDAKFEIQLATTGHGNLVVLTKSTIEGLVA